MTLDNVTDVVTDVKMHLNEAHFKARDADGQDFQYGFDPSLRFKIGCSYGEVTILVMDEGQQTEAIRIISEASKIEAFHRIDALIHQWTNRVPRSLA